MAEERLPKIGVHAPLDMQNVPASVKADLQAIQDSADKAALEREDAAQRILDAAIQGAVGRTIARSAAIMDDNDRALAEIASKLGL